MKRHGFETLAARSSEEPRRHKGGARLETLTIHSGEEPDLGAGGTGDVVAPIHLSSTFARRQPGRPAAGYEYSRTSNPTRDALEKRLAALEGAKHALAFASGLAAETTLLLSLLKPGDHVVASGDLYGGTRRLFDAIFSRFGISFGYADATDERNVERAMRKNTRLVWLETPSNPLLQISDISAISEIARGHGALLAVDNTFASPFLQQPLALGADLVLHSTTKYINGHSDSVGGAIMASDEKLHAALRFSQNAAGAILSPFDSYLVLRGSRTLAVRMERHCQNAAKVAEYLSGHPKVKRVIYPGLPSHPQHGLAKRQMSGFGGMISFELRGGEAPALRFLSSLSLFFLAESLGGVESLIEHPSSMTHSSLSAAQRRAAGINGSLIRASVGLEHPDDLISALQSALSKA